MSQNPARRSANLHTFDAATNFGQVIPSPRDEPDSAAAMRAGATSALRADGLESLFAANDDRLIDFSRLQETGAHRKGWGIESAEPDVRDVGPAWEDQGHHSHDAQRSTVPADLIAEAEAPARAARPDEPDMIHADLYPAPVSPAGALGAAPVISLADIVMGEDPLDKAFMPPPSGLGGAPKSDASLPATDSDMHPDQHRNEDRGEAIHDSAPFRAPALDQGLFSEP